MAQLEDLVREISDPRLRNQIAADVRQLKARKKFGLVFEEHLPEIVELPSLPVKPGVRVKRRQAPEFFTVTAANTKNATIVPEGGGAEETERKSELVIVKRFGEPVRYSAPLDAALPALIQAVKAHGFEGLVAKRVTSVYESGLRTGAWMKMRVNRGHEFVIGGYTRGTRTFDAIVFGYYEGDKLIYVARTRNGFTPVTRAKLFHKLRRLEIDDCPFVNPPEPKSGRWGQGLTKAKMAECQWLKPVLVGQFEFLESTVDNHLRHSKFVGLREDKRAKEVVRE